MHTRYCTSCDEEFRPEILRCSDCGGDLEDRYEGENGDPRPAEGPEAGEAESEAPPQEYEAVFGCMEPALLKEAADCLAAAGVPFRATGCSTGFQLLVREADRSAAAAALQGREGTLAVPDDAEPTVGAEGGMCPACGAAVPAAVLECPECGLVVRGE
jgi:hypothetical protein